MGSDLVSACVFCAGLLLGVDLPPPPGYHAEVGFSYATAARRYQIDAAHDDVSDVTPKFVLVGLGGSRQAANGLGAGTPEAEWGIRVALGPSHDEQEQTPFSVSNTTATGTGRYENFAIVLRYPLGARDSIEAGWNRRTQKATDLLDIGRERFFFTEERVLSAERVDVGLGLRHRWKGIEAAVSGRYVRPSASDTTAGVAQLTEGPIYGGALEARARRGRWTLAASAERRPGRSRSTRRTSLRSSPTISTPTRRSRPTASASATKRRARRSSLPRPTIARIFPSSRSPCSERRWRRSSRATIPTRAPASLSGI